MPEGWWIECVCRCISHVVMYDIALSTVSPQNIWMNYIWLKVLSPMTARSLLFFRRVMTLRMSLPLRLPFFLSVFLPPRQERWMQAWLDRPVTYQSEEAWPNSSFNYASNFTQHDFHKRRQNKFLLGEKHFIQWMWRVFAPSEQPYQCSTAWNPLCRKQGQRLCFTF